MANDLYTAPFGQAPSPMMAQAGSPVEQIKRALRKRVGIAILLFVVLCPVAVGLAILQCRPYYEAEALVKVSPTRPRILYRTDENASNQSYNSFMETQMNTVRSREVLDKCLADATVARLPLIAEGGNPLRTLQGALIVRRIGSTELFSVGLRQDSPQGLAYAVNTIIDTYMSRFEEGEAYMRQSKVRLLEDERKMLKLDIETKQAAVAKVREELASDPSAAPSMSAHDPVNTTLEAIIAAKTQQSSLRAKIDAYRKAIDADDINVPNAILEEAMNRDPEVERLASVDGHLRQALVAAQVEAISPPSVIIQQRINSEPDISTLKQEMARMELEVTMVSQDLSADHPSLKRTKGALKAVRDRLAELELERGAKIAEDVKKDADQRCKDLRAQLDVIAEQIKQTREKARPIITQRLKDDARADMERQIKEFTSEQGSAKTNEGTLTESFKGYIEQRKVYERGAGQMKSLEDEAARLQDSLRGVEQRLHEIDVESGAPGYVGIASMAVEPKVPEPFMAKRVKYSFVGAAGAAMVTLLVLILLERQDDRIWSAEDFGHWMGAEMLGSVPDGSLLLSPAADAGQAALICQHQPDSPFAEHVRNLTAGVLYPPDGKPVRTVLITSGAPGDGKTTMAVNLATCIAGLGKRVLLIDANFRKPDIAGIFGLGNVPGLGDILVYGDDVTATIHNVGPTNHLSVLTAGTTPSQPGLLLGSQVMKRLLDRFSAEHDYIIIDAPPLLLADARVLAPMVDGVLCSSKAHSSHRAVVEESLATLRRLGAHTIGVALTGVNPKYDGVGATTKALSTYTQKK